jgi:hypothetical protein
MSDIILTDWPKTKHIDANLRGIDTACLLSLREQLFHSMMQYTAEIAGGYAIIFDSDKIEAELKYRKVPLEEL